MCKDEIRSMISWSNTPYRVVEVPQENGEVDAVERADGSGDLRRVHRAAMQICPSEPHTCQPVRPSSKRTLQNSRGTDEFQREGESGINETVIAVSKGQSTRTDPVPVPAETPPEVDDPELAATSPRNQK